MSWPLFNGFTTLAVYLLAGHRAAGFTCAVFGVLNFAIFARGAVRDAW